MFLKRMISAAIIVGAVSVANPVSASEQIGTVSGYAIPVSGSIAVIVSGARTGTKPACATEDTWSIPGGQANTDALIGAIMTAKATGKTIGVTGLGVCDPNLPWREQVAYIYFN